MKGFIFRLCVVILILITIITTIYTDALEYRRDTFEASHGDIIYDSMIFTDFTPIKSADGQDQLVVGGSVYPDNDRNANKNVFFKLYKADGTLIATSGINEINCNLLLNDIEKTDYGFAIICEVRGDIESYGKIYEYSHEGKFINSVSLRYSKHVAQEAGTEYGISLFDGNTYYTATDSDKTICLDADGNYLFHIKKQEDSVVHDAVAIDNVIYTSGSLYNEAGIPEAFINAYNMTDGSLLWSQNDIIKAEENLSETYSQIEEIRIITENNVPVSVVAYGKFFDATAYSTYIKDNNIDLSEELDTVSKKCILETFSLYRTGVTENDYNKSPYPSAFFASADIDGNILGTKIYEADSEKSLSSISTGSASVETKDNFAACTVSVNTVNLTAEYFNTHLEVINSNLDTISEITIVEPTKYKTYFSVSTAGKLFTYTTINSTDSYSTKSFDSAQEYANHIQNLKTATDNIYYVREIIKKLPICIMVSMFYILTRIRSLSRGVGYIPKTSRKKKS
ncbi:MAG: hypothetical protein IJZ94_05205 [Clostridia bacterium]|nr:hypothetical protein [Clostridia bacterium]